MNEKDLNIEYICEETSLAKDDELVPIILDLIQDSYKAGLCQAEFDNTMNLIEENEELNQKYLNAAADYEITMAEKEQLNSLVNNCQEEIRKLKKQLEERTKMYLNAYKYAQAMENEVITLITQQKEFINYLEEKLNFYKINTQGYSMNLVEDILQKYKSIIGDDK